MPNAGAYRYSAKEDPNTSPGNCLEKHAELTMIAKNKVAALENTVYRENRNSINEDFELASHQNKTIKLKSKRIDKLDIVEYIRKEKMVTLTKLMAAAWSRREAGDAKLAIVIFKMT